MRVKLIHVIPIALVVYAMALSGCGVNPSPNASPQAKVAHHGATVLDAVTTLQKGITAAASSSPAFVPTAQTITGVVEKIHARATQLGAALRTYDAAATLDARRLAEIAVQQQVAAINTLLSEVFDIKISDANASQIVSLIVNVAKTVTTLSAELAKMAAPAPQTQL